MIYIYIYTSIANYMNGGKERCIRDFGGKIRGKETKWKTKAWMGLNFKWIFRKWDAGVCTVLIWFRTGIGGRHL
jgi:hypothetical protein